MKAIALPCIVSEPSVEWAIVDWGNQTAIRAGVPYIFLSTSYLPVGCVFAKLITGARKFGIEKRESLNGIPYIIRTPKDRQFILPRNDPNTVLRK
jgi:hypothetical protein